MSTDLPIKGEVEVLRLQPDDVLVFTTSLHLGQSTLDTIHRQASERFPGHKVVILSGGLRLSSVVREGRAAA